MKVFVTSTNKIKVAAVEYILKQVLKEQKFEIVSASIPSKVKDQPTTLAETKQGAVNRIMGADEMNVDFYISIESGVEREFDQFYSFTFVAVSNSQRTQFSFGTSAKFQVPDDIAHAIETGKTLSAACHDENGLISYLTNGFMTRKQLIEQALTVALIPFHFYPTPLPDDAPKELTKYASELTPTEMSQLASQIRSLDFTPPKTFTQTTGEISVVEPPEDYDENADVLSNGREAICNGEVAVVIMAGGQGSRLGAPVPKALMDIGLPSHQTLLEIQLKRIKKLISMFKQYGQAPKGIPTYILTSDDTHSAIAAYLLQNQNFGLPLVKLVKQPKLPVELDDHFALANRAKVLAAPNGNGAIFETLQTTGAIAEMRSLGVEYVEIHPIDNVLAKPADPFFVGAMIYDGGDCALKVLRKKFNGERVGTVCKKNGKTVVVEYSELPEEKAHEHIWANTAMHLFTIDAVENAASVQLPYHVAIKKEKVLIDGQIVEKEVKKFERFIFDAMEYCEQCTLVEVDRDAEFAPVKNAAGSGIDCPETARAALLKLHREMAENAGIVFEGEGDFEIRPETAYDGEGLDELGIETVTLPMVL